VIASRLNNGNLLVPKRAETNGTIGDALVEIGPDDPEFQAWITYLNRIEAESIESGSDVSANAPSI